MHFYFDNLTSTSVNVTLSSAFSFYLVKELLIVKIRSKYSSQLLAFRNQSQNTLI